MAEGAWIEEAKKNSGLLIFLGVMTVIFGLVAVASPLITGVAVAVFVGFLLLASGVARIIHALKSRQWGTGFWGTVIGILGVAAGLLMIFRPLVGLVTMTLLIAAYFLIDGLCEIIAAFKIKPDQGWGWVLFNGVIAVVLGLMIWRQWPVSGAWAIGLLVGIHILMTGWSMIILGTGARRIAGTIEEAVEEAAEAASEIAEKAADIAEDAVDTAKDMAEDAADTAGDMVDKAKDFAGDVADKTEDVVDDVVDKAKDTFGGERKD
jgi:uncharacterized membrane protein HdeD (DUF308 family)